MRQTIRVGAVLAVAALLSAACGSSPNRRRHHRRAQSSSPSVSTAGKFLGCMVTDTGGIDDKSFNASSYQGMLEAQTAEPSKVAVKSLQSNSPADYASNITAFLGLKCGIIVTVGFLMASATRNGGQGQLQREVRDRGLPSLRSPERIRNATSTPN